MAKIITAQALFSKHVTHRDHVLLLNPPVEETRYSWLRWNQPLDLLKIGSRLRNKVACGIELLDCMKPDENGKVAEARLPRDRRDHFIKGDKYPMRLFGQSYGTIAEKLAPRAVENGKRSPTQVWITSLCSYWHQSVAQVCRIVRETLPEAKIVLVGQYAELLPQHAAEFCATDYVVSKTTDLSTEPPALDLYGRQKPEFVALQLNPKLAINTVVDAVERGIYHFAFFEDDICRDSGEPLEEIVAKTKELHKHLRYHFICGLDPAKVTPGIAKILADKSTAESHFEQVECHGEFDAEPYRRVRAYLREAGMRDKENRLSGFVWIGRPGEDIEGIILRSFQVLNHLESLILKPYTPTPNSSDHLDNADYLAKLPHREWSPHFFPFAELNEITRDDYHDLYRMAAFLNEKVRAGSFDFLKGTLDAQMLRESLRKEVWKLEPSPLRLID